MTEESMARAELVQKVGEGDCLRTVAEAVLQLLMEADIEGLIGAILLEQHDEWQLQHRYMQLEAMAELAPPANDAE